LLQVVANSKSHSDESIPYPEHETVTFGAVLACNSAGIPGSSTRKPGAEPIRLQPENPHYSLWQGKPAILVTSGEQVAEDVETPGNFNPSQLRRAPNQLGFLLSADRDGDKALNDLGVRHGVQGRFGRPE
jgi:hypothetical protein